MIATRMQTAPTPLVTLPAPAEKGSRGLDKIVQVQHSHHSKTPIVKDQFVEPN